MCTVNKSVHTKKVWKLIECTSYLPVHPLISIQALCVLVMFGSTYLCEAAFSTLVAIKTKYRNKLEVEGDLRCALSGIKPRINELFSKKQCEVSH